MFGKMFGKGKSSKGNGDGQRPPIPTTFQPLQEMAFHHTQALTSAHQQVTGIGEAEHWDVDLAAGTITWTFPDKVVRAPAQLIATWNGSDDTLLWGWDHPSAPPGTAVAATAMRDYAETHSIQELLVPKVSCSFDEGWQLTSIAVLIGDLQGIYRGQASETAWAYIGYGNPTISKT